MTLKRKRDSLPRSQTAKSRRKTNCGVDDGPKDHPPSGATLANLPYHIINNILLKLPIKSVLICRCVCKSWHSIMSDPHMAQLYSEYAPITALLRTSDRKCVSRNLHLFDFEEFTKRNNYVLDHSHVCSCKDSPQPNCDSHVKLEVKFKLPLCDSKMVLDTMLEARRRGKRRTNDIACRPRHDKFDIVNSCNGLLLLCGYFQRNSLFVSNPFTGEFIRLPKSENDGSMTYRNVYLGFGYLKKTNEYKVVRIYRVGIAEIHTLGTGLWRNLKIHCSCRFNIKYPICLNGSLNWFYHDMKERSILCFNLQSETFSSFPCPYEISSVKNVDAISQIYFGEFKECLYLSCRDENEKCFKVWSMKKYGDSESWTRFLHFNSTIFCLGPYYFNPLEEFFMGPRILIYGNSRFFVCFGFEEKLAKFLECRGTSLELKLIFHTPNLMRLKDIVKDQNTEVFNVHTRCGTFKLQEDKEVLYIAKHIANLRLRA